MSDGQKNTAPAAGQPAEGDEPALVLIFDLDGTLVSSSRDIHNALAHALGAVDDGRRSADADAEALRQGGHGLPLERFFSRARPDATAEGLDAFVAAYRSHYYTHLLDNTAPCEGVVAGLERLATLRDRYHAQHGRRRMRLAVATTKMTATAHKVVQGLGLHSYFDEVLGSDGLPPKPDPAVLHAVLKKLGRRPVVNEREAVLTTNPRAPSGTADLMVGDTDYDILAGRAAGLLTCAVAWSELPHDRLRAVRPDYFIKNFQELVDLITRLALVLMR